jgi:TP901 family phage tail tape measure protein
MSEVIGNVGAVAYDIVSQDKTSKGADSASKTIGKMSLAVGASMTAIGVSSKLMADDINRSYMSFEDAMANVKSLGGLTIEQYDEMKTAAVNLSKELPLSAEQVAQGMYMMRSAGYDANKTIAEMPAIADMAVAGNLEMADAVNATTAVLDAYGDRAGDAGHVTDVLMGTVQAFKTTLPELQMEMAKNIGVASNLGISFEELSAMNGMLKKDFVGAEEAGTALKTMMMKLVDPANVTKLDTYGISVRDAKGEFVGMESLLDQLSKTMNEAGGSVGSMGALTSIFGTEGVRAAMSLARQKDELGPYTDMLEKGGQVQEALNAQLETTSSKLDIANNKMDAAKIAMGEAMAPSTILVSDAMSGFAGVLEGLPEGMQTAIGAGLQLSQAFIGIGPMFMAIGPAMTAYSAIQSGTLVPSLYAAAAAGWAVIAPWAPFILAAAGIVAVLYILEDQFGLVTWAIDGLWSIGETLVGWIKGAFTGGLGEGSDALLLFLGPIGAVIYAFQHWDEILPMITGVFDDVIEFIEGMFTWFGDAGGKLIEMLVDGILSSPLTPWGALTSILGPVSDLLPHSPAKAGPLAFTPNWDSYLVDPIVESGPRMVTALEMDAGEAKDKMLDAQYQAAFEKAGDAKKTQDMAQKRVLSLRGTDGPVMDSALLGLQKAKREQADAQSELAAMRNALAVREEEKRVEAENAKKAEEERKKKKEAEEEPEGDTDSLKEGMSSAIDESSAKMGATLVSAIDSGINRLEMVLKEQTAAQVSAMSVGGDTLHIETINVRDEADIKIMFDKWESMQRAKRIKRGIRA